jgi:hypothetical protein
MTRSAILSWGWISAAGPYASGQLQFFGELQPLRDPPALARYLGPLRQSEWVVYAKPPFGGPQQVIEYLGRYTHRVAISNERLLAFEDDQVSFRWKDYRHPQRPKVMTVSADEFTVSSCMPSPRAFSAFATMACWPMLIAPPSWRCAANVWPPRVPSCSPPPPMATTSTPTLPTPIGGAAPNAGSAP